MVLIFILIYFEWHNTENQQLPRKEMNAKETVTIATIPLERVLTQRARFIVHVSLGLREME